MELDKKTPLEIKVKDKEGKEHKLSVDWEDYILRLEWNNYLEYKLWKYPPLYLQQNPGMRIPDREGEEESFENWKLRGEPKPALFSYGVLVENKYEAIKKLLGI